MAIKKVGILLANVGTPDEPTVKAVRYYLKQFLSHRHVVELSPLLWWPILYGFILPFRSRKTAKLYRKIWFEQGSPLLFFSNQLQDLLQQKITCTVQIGMHYGTPSIEQALLRLQETNVETIIVLPLYPQYSRTTTAASFDIVVRVLKNWRHIPEIHFLHDYAAHPEYIQALAHSIKSVWEKEGKAEHLLFSFHGIPLSYSMAGDPYQARCKLTAQLVAQELKLSDEWSVAFQSRLGRKWLTPFTDTMLRMFPQQGIKHLQVICPGFAVDCLETLEEIAIRGKEQFLSHGGLSFRYIPSLNNSSKHIEALAKLLLPHISNISYS